MTLNKIAVVQVQTYTKIPLEASPFEYKSFGYINTSFAQSHSISTQRRGGEGSYLQRDKVEIKIIFVAITLLFHILYCYLTIHN